MVPAGQISAQNGMLSVISSNNGRGLYTYTFTNGGSIFFWGLSPISQGIYLQSYGVIQTTQPAGWTATVTPGGLVNWQVTNGTFYFDQGVTLSVFSSFAVPRYYNDDTGGTFFSTGTLLGEIYTNDSVASFLGGGSTSFVYVGPNTNNAPTLACAPAVNGLTLGWPMAATGYTLQTTATPVITNSWIIVTNSFTSLNRSNFVTIPFGAGAQFFRMVNTNGG
jgi:hypothetical protein